MADKETEYTIVTQGEGKDDSGTPVFDCKPEEVFLFCGIPGGVHFDILVFGWKRDGKTYLRMRFRNEDSGDVLTGDVASESQLKEMVDNVVESFSEMGNCKFEALWRYGDEAAGNEEDY